MDNNTLNIVTSLFVAGCAAVQYDPHIVHCKGNDWNCRL